MTETIETRQAPQPTGAYSQGVATGSLVFSAGQIGRDPETGVVLETIEAQTRQALKNTGAILEAADSGLGMVLKTTVYLRDLDDFVAFNDAYAEIIPEPLPARTTIGAHLHDGVLVEIDAIATRR